LNPRTDNWILAKKFTRIQLIILTLARGGKSLVVPTRRGIRSPSFRPSSSVPKKGDWKTFRFFKTLKVLDFTGNS
jgi:hypothetical protein